MTTLEFICAQAPFTLKGFMIGMWYSMRSIRYILIGNIDSAMHHAEDTPWIVYESIKIGLVGLSLIIFGIVCRWYRYRERNEVVNVQGMIEDIIENELLQQKNEDTSDNEDSITTYNTFN
jgi:peptide/histidine transporter 3/4